MIRLPDGTLAASDARRVIPYVSAVLILGERQIDERS
jgi:hypothetical protein